MNNKNENKISCIIEVLREYFSSQPDVKFAFLHGSILEEGRNPHDIDIAVMFAPEPENSIHRCFELEREIEEITRSMINLPVDIRPLNEAPLGFRYYVVKGKLIFSKDDDEAFSFISLTTRMYWDWLPRVKHYISNVRLT